MADYPVVGQDRNAWGDKLKAWDFVSHNPDGTLKQSVIDDVRDGLATETSVEGLQNAVNAQGDDLADLETTVTSHTGNTSNPHSVTKSQVGLANAENTSDANKPVSTATQAALDLKADASAVTSALALKADTSSLTSHTGNTSNPHAVTKTQVGLGNADNTSDLNKPISTLTQAALDALNLRPVTTKTANYTATTADYTIRVDATAGPVTITLPATVVGDVFEIEKIDASANDVIVDGDGSDVINIPGTGPAATATIDGQFSLLIVKCTVANQWTWISAVGNVT